MGQCRAAAGGGDCLFKLFGKTIPVPADSSGSVVDKVGVYMQFSDVFFLYTPISVGVGELGLKRG